MGMELLLKQAAFAAEVASLSAAGDGIVAENSTSHGADELPTCKGYVDQHERIVGLLLLYKELVQKDISDLSKMASTLSQLDSELSSAFEN